MIEFLQQFSLKNGNKVTKKNWHKVVAVATEPCTNVRHHAIDAIRDRDGAYYERWQLVWEESKGLYEGEKSGYIFREVNHGGGICGRHDSFKMAIWTALSPRIRIYLED